MSENIKNDFFLERYKYILEQKKSFLSATFKVLALYQAVILAISTLQFKVLEKYFDGNMSISLAKISTWYIYWVHFALAAFCILMLFGGIVTWLGYKREEKEIERNYLLEKAALTGQASHFKFLGWFEFWIILGIISFNVFHLYIVYNHLIKFIES